MLSGQIDNVDLIAFRDRALSWIPMGLKRFALDGQKVWNLKYPILSVPTKIISHNLDKEEEFTDTLTGIKGQYLIFKENVVLNIRKHTGYNIRLDY